MFVFIFANFLVIPLAIFSHPSGLGPSPRASSSRASTPVKLDVDPVVMHRRHHGGPMATFLPAVEHHRQAHHAALDQLRAVDTASLPRDGVRASLIMAVVPPRFTGTPLFGHYTNAGGVAHGLATQAGTGRARSSPSSAHASIIGAASVTARHFVCL